MSAPAARIVRALRAFGPAMGWIAPAEAARAATGAALGIFVTGSPSRSEKVSPLTWP